MKQALLEFINDSWHWIAGVFIGLLGKISYDVAMKRTMNFLEWLSVLFLSVLVGYLTALFCDWKGWHEQSNFLVPLMTLFGEKIIVYFMTNYKSILDRFIKPKKDNK